MPFNPEIKAQWLHALRSGEYAQGQGHLRTDEDKFCCLGVLTDLAVEAGVAEWTPCDSFGLYGDLFGVEEVLFEGTDDERSVMNYLTATPRVLEWAGLNGAESLKFGESGYIPGLDNSLTRMNDNGMTFNEIADIIEEYL